jgi:hypothetical protein
LSLRGWDRRDFSCLASFFLFLIDGERIFYDDTVTFSTVRVVGSSLHHGAWVTGYESIEEAREKLIDLALKQLDPKGDYRRYRMWLWNSRTQNLGSIPL